MSSGPSNHDIELVADMTAKMIERLEVDKIPATIMSGKALRVMYGIVRGRGLNVHLPVLSSILEHDL